MRLPYKLHRELYWYDGLSIFTLYDADRKFYYAHWWDQIGNDDYYVVVPFTKEQLKDLLDNNLSFWTIFTTSPLLWWNINKGEITQTTFDDIKYACPDKNVYMRLKPI